MQRSTDRAPVLARLLAGIERELPRAIDLRHRLHAHPELAHAEHRTSALVAEALPVPAVTVAGTGLLARIGSAAGTAVGVRAELDGLPIAERTGAPFSADPALGAMHACGHDVHMSALVALARAAYALHGEERDGLPAPLLVVLQPSEEAYPSGAKQLVDELMSSGDPPSLAGIVAAHVHPELPWGEVALDPGTVNASCDHVAIAIEGRSAHGAYPHRGRDPILALAQVVVELHAQIGRRIDPLHPATLTVGMLEGGSAENVIPERARARASLRAYRPEDRQALSELVEDVVAGVAGAHGCHGSVELTAGEPPLENDPALVSRARALLAEVDAAMSAGTGGEVHIGAGPGAGGEAEAAPGLRVAPPWRSCGSDDFAFFGMLGAPLAMAFVGLDGADAFTSRPLHHPELLVPDAAVRAVARALAVLYVAAAVGVTSQPLFTTRS